MGKIEVEGVNLKSENLMDQSSRIHWEVSLEV